MQVQDIMVHHAKSCRPDTSLAEAVEIMWNNDCGALPILDNAGKVVGMITDRNVCIALGTRNRLPSEIKVSEVASREIYTCAPQDDVRAALYTMQIQKVRRLPVVDDDGMLQGILCLDDIVLNAEKTPALSAKHLIETFQAIYEHPVPDPGRVKSGVQL
jgi:CBS domain-containing protein